MYRYDLWIRETMQKRKGTTKSKGQKHSLDKFYTKTEIAAELIKLVDIKKFNTVIEPSAGSGAFSKQIKACIALDIDPEDSSIIKQNFLTYYPDVKEGSKILVIGNPPFGQQNSQAIKFINHAAKFADRVAFILPLSFKKESIIKRLDKKLHLTYEMTLPYNSFTLNGSSYNVNSVFQIWDVKPFQRVYSEAQATINENKLFTYVKKEENPDMALQRIGGNAGKVFKNWKERSPNSNYFIKLKKEYGKKNIKKIIEILNNIEHSDKDNTVGPRSISKRELNKKVNEYFDLFKGFDV